MENDSEQRRHSCSTPQMNVERKFDATKDLFPLDERLRYCGGVPEFGGLFPVAWLLPVGRDRRWYVDVGVRGSAEPVDEAWVTVALKALGLDDRGIQWWADPRGDDPYQFAGDAGGTLTRSEPIEVFKLVFGWVYFLQAADGGLVKIGFSGDPDARALRIQYMSSSPLRLLGLIRGVRAHETEIHRKFRHLRAHGEWFKPARELLDFLGREAR